MTNEELDKQVDEFEYFYNHVIKLVHNNVVKPIPPLTDYQKEFVKYIIRCKAEGFNPASIEQRTRRIPSWVRYKSLDADNSEENFYLI